MNYSSRAMSDFHPDPSLLDPLQSLFEDSQQPVWALVQFDFPATRNAYLPLCPDILERHEHINIDLAGVQLKSLETALSENAPESVFKGETGARILHVTGLEASFLEEIMAGHSKWVPDLEASKDALLSAFPFGIVIWTDAYTVHKIAAEAPGFAQALAGTLTLTGAEPEDELATDATPFEALTHAGKWEQALKQIQSTLADGVGAPYGYAHLRYLTGNIFFDHQRWELAAGFYRDVTELETTADNRIWIAKGHRATGAAYANKGDWAEGLEALDIAAEQFEEMEEYEALGRTFNSASQIYQAMGKQVDALQHRMYAAESYREAGLHDKTGYQLRMAATLYEQKGKLDKAIGLLEESIDAYCAAEDHLEQARICQHIGSIRQRQMKWGEALKVYQKALPLAQGLAIPFLVESIEDSIRDMEEKTGAKPGGKKGLLGRLFG